MPRGNRAARARRWSVVAFALLAVLALAGCADEAPLDTLDPAGKQADDIQNLVWIVFPVAGVVGLIVLGAVVFVMFRFRHRDGDEAVPHQIHGNTKLEIMWTIAPAVILAAIAIPTVATIFELQDKPSGEIMKVNVWGQQWWWQFDYPDSGVVTSNDLVIPEDTTVELTISSRDVIHSFWVPRLNGKKDAVPGRFHTLLLEAHDPGEYWGHCTEFCGLSHANMRMRTIVLSEADYAAWLENQQAAAVDPNDAEDPNVLEGATTFAQLCVTCHQVDGLADQIENVPEPAAVPQVAGAAPNLTHLMSRTVFAGGMFDLRDPDCAVQNSEPTGTAPECLNRNQLEAWLRDPGAEKPMQYDPVNGRGGNRGMPDLNLSEDQIDDLVSYLSTLQ